MRKPKRRAPGGGRKPKYGEPAVRFTCKLPVSVVDLLDDLGPSRSEALVGIVLTSVQYRLANPQPAFPLSLK